MRLWKRSALGLAAVCAPMAAQAEIVEASESGFVTKDMVVVDASAKETWLALISPGDWWAAQHTWSGDAGNLRLTPQAGGCFCEKIPEVVTPDSFTLEGSVEHMRVIQAYPERVLRMKGALGPLQSEPVTGILTIVLTEIETPEGIGTRIVWEYNVGGSMRYEVPVISSAVDGVMSLQLAGLADKLGRLAMPAVEAAPAGNPGTGEPADGDKPQARIERQDPAEKTDEPAHDAAQAADAMDKGPSVDDAFEDLSNPLDAPPD